MNKDNLSDFESSSNPNSGKGITNDLQGLLAELGLDEIQPFTPVLYSEDGDCIFLSEDTSFSISSRSISEEFSIESRVREIFPNPIEKARGKPIELEKPIGSTGFFWLRRNHDDDNGGKIGDIVGFRIQGLNSVWDDKKFTIERGKKILTQMVSEYSVIVEKNIDTKDAYYYLLTLLSEE